MEYFKILGIILGSVISLLSVVLIIARTKAAKFLERIYTPERPQSVLFFGGALLFLTIATWIMFFLFPELSHFVVTAVITVWLFKAALFVFAYAKTREVFFALINEPLAFKTVFGSAALCGIAIFFMSVFF